MSKRNHAIWIGPLVALGGGLSYFTLFARFAPLRDFPWINLPLVLVGLGLSAIGAWRAFTRPGALAKALGSVGLVLSLAVASLFGLYVFVFSSMLPEPASLTLELSQAPDFTLLDQAGRPVTLAEFRGRKVVLVFYRGYW